MTNQTLPDWFCSPAHIQSQTIPTRKRHKIGLSVRMALASIGKTLAQELCSSPCLNTWLGRVEPRAKVLGIFVLVFTSTFLHSLYALSILFAIALIVGVSISVSTMRMARVWMGVPLFSLALILPATTNIVTHGTAVLTIWKLGHSVNIGSFLLPSTVYVTSEGLIVATRFLLRTINCITLSYLLVSTTDSQTLLSSLRRLGMPKMFGMVLTMAQRYVEVVLRAAEEIHLAKLSRTIYANPIRNEQRWAATGIGILFRRTHRLAEEVHHAMLSRGFDGDLQVSSRSIWHISDTIWLILLIVLAAALVALDRRFLEAIIG